MSSEAVYSALCASHGFGLSNPSNPATREEAEARARDLCAAQGHEHCLHRVYHLFEPLAPVASYFRGRAVTGQELPRYDVRQDGETTASFPGEPDGMDHAWTGVRWWLRDMRSLTGVTVVSVAEDGAETLELG
jgi:hypothetical protein